MPKQLIKKILLFIIIHFYWNNKIPLEIIFTDEYFFQNKIKKFNYFVFYHRQLYKFIISPIITKYKNTHSSTPFIDQIIKEYLTKQHEKQDERTSLCILRLIYEFETENNLLCNNALEIVSKTNNPVIKYWLIQNIETFIFWRTLTIPSNYYTLRKNWIKEFCLSIFDSKSLPVKKDRINGKKKLCIITYLLGDSLRNSAQRVLNMLTNNIDKSFFDISVVCLDSFFCREDNITNITFWKNSYSFKNKSKSLLHKDTKIYYCNSKSIISKMKSSLEIIYNINPDLIIDMSDEYSMTSYFYSKDFTTLYLPLRGRVTSSYCTIYKSSDYSETTKQNLYYNNVLSNTKIIEWSFPEYIMNSEKKYTRKEVKLPNDSFILVSAGALPQDDISFYSTMIEILDSNSDFLWIIIGTTIPKIFSDNYSKYFEEKRIIEWGFEDNLDSLYRICNVFVNPNKTGGSGTIAIAAQQKLPIVITTFPSDAMRWIKKENCLSGYNQYKNEILKLYNDKNYYKNKSNLFF